MVFGRLLGALFGASVAGPLGALVGCYVGYHFDQGLKGAMGGHARPPEALQHAFFETTFSVMGHIARVDAPVNEQEIATARAIMAELHLNEAQRLSAMRAFNRGKEPGFAFLDAVQALKRLSQGYWPLLRLFVELQFKAAYADGRVGALERALLYELGGVLGFQQNAMRQLEARHRAEHAFRRWAHGHPHHQAHGHFEREQHEQAHQGSKTAGMGRDEALSVLGLDHRADAVAIKRAYRKLMSEHHPDKMMAKGLPPEMIRLATEKVQKIQEAYEVAGT